MNPFLFMLPQRVSISKWIADRVGSSSWRIMPWWRFGEKRGIQGSLLRLMSVAHSEQIELAPLVSLLASEHRMLTRRRLQKLATRLASGTPWVDALEQTPRLIDDHTMLAIRFALQSGTLKTELPRIVEQDRRSLEVVRFSTYRSFSYYACMSLITFFFLLFLATFILPTYARIFQELEVPNLRALTSLNLSVMLIFSFSIPVFCLLIILSVAAWLVSPFQWFRRLFASRLFRFVAERRSAQLLRLLATACDAGRPLAGSMSTLARYHFDRAIRAKLLFARNEIELGAEPWSCLATSRLLSIDEATSLANSTSPKTRSWLMQQLAKVKEDKVRRGISIVTSLIHPTIIVVLGLLVLWIALACYGSLVYLVETLSK